ncbi:50S ribosomal protein L7ae-like protein [Bacillus badius]|uniref:Firmicutes ribosomal L7Ae family protein n=1 Tax=Bacillus badius TaxID=1455 RepID=A0ABR5AQ47_BACBA|nr:50S ribosomal protein L7ae-like protein [Bacillus badius]KIL72093.1 Firmicutes ribosomal L7Ae family protein [Bacillus badius]KIL76873.1 Firmicutes ribosomal L7Ae family protein [Bacillus badius]KZO00576.1 ribosomal protein L7Ae-like protein [Bacillus badius]KZR60546.1 ribosomal protein L7Ae-like protein [Bacillus badius]MED0668114.1 50S ribosomal protein L7ae-like protein [Bacillus badius]
MSYDKVAKAQHLAIGTKQTVRALERDQAQQVMIAADASPFLRKKVEDLAKQKAVPFTYVDSMLKLGKACGIDVKAAAVAIINE